MIKLNGVENVETKPCPHCDFSVRDIGERMKPGSDPFILIKDEGQVFIATDDSSFVILPINYCPMCGREFSYRHQYGLPRKYCSRACAIKGRAKGESSIGK